MPKKASILFLNIAVFSVGVVVWAAWPLFYPISIAASTTMLDRDGGVLFVASNPEDGLRTPVSFDRFPASLRDATVASEDGRFYQHHGVDALALARAIKDVITTGHENGGASTIDQQVVRRLYFPSASRTVIQKCREMIVAVIWSGTHTKQETLETYLNIAPFGGRYIGAAAAARGYFQKDIADLTLGESAMLAGMLPAPSAYDPIRHPAAARSRERIVLDRMIRRDFVSSSTADEVFAQPVKTIPPTQDLNVPLFVQHVLDELEAQFPDIRSGGYTVRTTLDPALQASAEGVIERRLFLLRDQHVEHAAMLAADPRTGDILVYAGNGWIDMIQQKRQPGSALKPFMYFAAFMRGFTPATIIADLPVRFTSADGSTYAPRNYGLKYNGPVSIRDALGSSLNVPAVKVLDQIGLSAFFNVLGAFGLAFPEQPESYGLGVVLGGGEVTLWGTLGAYARLALGAKTTELRDVLEVRNRRGDIVYHATDPSHTPLFEKDVLARQSAALITDILSDPLARARSFGESNLLDVGGKRVAIKTGTTKDFRDNWAFGYTPTFVLGVWVGNADNTPMQGVSGITGAVPIWHDIMQDRLRDERIVEWPNQPELVKKEICTTSGLLANGICPKTRVELFIPGTEPTMSDTWYVRCGREIVLAPPPEYAGWLQTTRRGQPSDGCGAATTSTALMILSPLDGDVFQRDELVNANSLGIPFMAGGISSGSYQWTLNGQRIESDSPTYIWTPQPGEYTLTLQGSSDQVHFIVR